MGCDIHVYTEYSEDGTNWYGFGGRINPGRDYGMFGIIAGLRTGDEPLYPLKGLPADAGWEAGRDAHLIINDEYADDDGYCSTANAEQWAKHGETIILNPHNGKPWRVTHPDWHSHTWLSREEYEEVLREYQRRYPSEKVGTEWWGLLGAMAMMAGTGAQVRLVIWFDN